MAIRNCIVCGRAFTPTTPNGKYCGVDCAIKGQAFRRKEWEAKTDYLGKRRKQAQEKRDRERAEREKERAAAEKEAERARKKRDALQKQRRENTIRRAAAGGDPFARMALESLKHGNMSVEYWAAWRDYDCAYAASLGKVSRSTVNGISVQEENFPELVAESLQFSRTIIERVQYERR